MFAKRSPSIRKFSLAYALFYNVRKSFAFSLIKPKISVVDANVVQRQYSNIITWTCNIFLQAQTFANIHFGNVKRRVSSTDCIKDSFKMLNYLPFFASGNIVSGFGRGSKELGIPTANFPLEVVKSLPDCFKTGIYYGWANIDNGPVYKMVMSIGWNPFYHNKEKSIETHILHNFNRDLYGSLLKVCIVGYIRPEQNFDSVDDLVSRIKEDIRQAEDLLESNEVSKQLANHQFFLENNSDSNKNK